MHRNERDAVTSTGQIDDNQDDLGRDVADTDKTESPRHPQNDAAKPTSRKPSGDAIHDGGQH